LRRKNRPQGVYGAFSPLSGIAKPFIAPASDRVFGEIVQMPVRLVKRIGVILTYASKGLDENGKKKRESRKNEFKKAFERMMSRFQPQKDDAENIVEGGRKDAKEK